jgi:hypothetical protein
VPRLRISGDIPVLPTLSFNGVDSVHFTLSCSAVLGGWVGELCHYFTLPVQVTPCVPLVGSKCQNGQASGLRWLLRLRPEERFGLRVLVYDPWHNKLVNGLP